MSIFDPNNFEFSEFKKNLDTEASNILSDKTNILQERKQEKINRLSPMKLQEKVGESISNLQVYKDNMGGYVDEAGNKVTDEVGTLYFADNPQGEHKIGVSRGSFHDRYDPEQHPTWTFGTTHGVDKDRPLAEILMRRSDVDKVENLIHTNRGQLLERAAGQEITPEEKAAYGGGVTEYTTDDAPFWNVDYKDPGTAIKPTTYVPELDPDSTKSKSEGQFSSYINLLKKSKKEQEGFANAVKGAAYTFGSGVLGTLDLVPEVAEYAYKNLTTKEGQDWSDTEGLYDKEAEDNFKEWVGYNDKVLNGLGAEVVAGVKDAWEKEDYGRLLNSLWEGVKTPEVALVSMGYVASMILPGTLANKVLKVTKGVDKAADAAVLADKTGKLTKAQAVADIEAKQGAGYKIAKALTGNLGYIGEAERFSREAEELYEKTYGEEMPTGQRLLLRAGGMLYGKMDAITAKAIVAGKDPIAKLVPEIVHQLPNRMKANFVAKTAILSGAPIARVAGAFGLEASTEALQTAMEKVGGLYKQDEVGVSDVLEDQAYEIVGGGLLGGVGGAQMASPSIAAESVLKPAIKSAHKASGYMFHKDPAERNPETYEGMDPKEKRDHYQHLATFTVLDVVQDNEKTNENIKDTFERTKKLHGIEGELSEDMEAAVYEMMSGKVLNSINTVEKANSTAMLKVAAALANNAPNEKALEAVMGMVKRAGEVLATKAAPTFIDAINRRLESGETLEGLELSETEKKNIAELRKELVTLGSEMFDGEVHPEEVLDIIEMFGDPKNRPNYQQVSDQIEKSGTTIFGQYKKSMNQHVTDITEEILSNKAFDDSIITETSKLENFVASRHVGKLNPVKKVQNEKGAFESQVRSVTEIKTLADKILKENEGIKTSIEKLINAAKESDDKNIEANLQGQLKSINASINDYKDILQENNIETLVTKLYNAQAKGSKPKKYVDEYPGGIAQVVKEMSAKAGPTVDSTTDEAYTKAEAEAEVAEKELQKMRTPKGIEEVQDTERAETESRRKYFEDTAKQLDPEASDEVISRAVDKMEVRYQDKQKAEAVQEDEAEKVAIEQELDETPKSIEDVKPTERAPKKPAKDEDTKAEYEAVLKDVDAVYNEIGSIKEEIVELEEVSKTAKEDTIGFVEAEKKELTDEKLEVARKGYEADTKITELKDKLRGLYEYVKKNVDRKLEDLEGIDSIRELRNAVKVLEKRIKGDTTTTEKIAALDSKLIVKSPYKTRPSRIFSKLLKKDYKIGAITDEAVKEFKTMLPKAYVKRFENEAKGKNVPVNNLLRAELSNVRNIMNRTNKSMQMAVGGNINSLTGGLNSKSRGGLLAHYANGVDYGMRIDENGKAIKEPLKIAEEVQEFFKNLDKDKNDLYTDGETYNAVVGAIMHTAAVGYGDMLNVKSLRGEALDTYIEEITGLAKDSVDFANVKNLVETGKAVPMAGLRRSLGQKVMSELGIAVDENQNRQLQYDMEAVFGQMVVETMKDSNIDAIGINGSTYQRVDTTGVDIKLLEVNVNPVMEKKLLGASSLLEFLGEQSDGMVRTRSPKVVKEGAKVRNSTVDLGKDSIEYINRKNSEEYKFSGSMDSLYKSLADKHSYDFDAMVKDATTTILGSRDRIIEEEQVSNIESKLAAYDAQALEIYRMFKAYELVDGKGFYLDWDYTVGGRYMVTNKLLNPQNGKISRFLTHTKDMEGEVDRNSEDFKEDLNIIKLAMAQVLDEADLDVDAELGVDKLKDSTVLEELDKVITFNDKGQVEYIKDDKLRKAYDAFAEKGVETAIKKLDFVDTKARMHALQMLDTLHKLNTAGDKFRHGLTIEADGITNGMIILLLQMGGKRAKELLKAGGVYFEKKDLKLTHGEYLENGEKDIYSTPVEGLEEALKKIDDMIDDKANKYDNGNINYNKLAGRMVAEKIRIEYQMEADGKTVKTDADGKWMVDWKAMRERAKQMVLLRQMMDMHVGGKWRSALKPMVMVFIYGAGMGGIMQTGGGKNSYGAGMIVDGLVKSLKEGKISTEQAVEAMKTLGVENIEFKVYDKNTGKLRPARNEERTAKNLYVSEEATNKMTEAFSAIFRKTFTDVFDDSFGEITEFRRTLKALSVIQYAVFRDSLRKKLNEKGIHPVGDRVDIGKKQLEEILDEMKEDGTFYGTKNSQGTWLDYTSMERVNGTDKDKLNVFQFYTDKDGKPGKGVGQYAISLQKFSQWFTSNVGAVGVINAHDVDGHTMSQGNKTGALNIYDALVLFAGMSSKEAVGDMNTALKTISENHDIVGKSLELVAKHLKDLNVDELEMSVVNKMKEDLKWIFEAYEMDMDPEGVLAGIGNSTVEGINTNREGRKELKGSMSINHYYVADQFADTDAKNYNPVIDDTSTKGIVEFFEALGRRISDGEAESKVEDGTISVNKVLGSEGKGNRATDVNNLMNCK